MIEDQPLGYWSYDEFVAKPMSHDPPLVSHRDLVNSVALSPLVRSGPYPTVRRRINDDTASEPLGEVGKEGLNFR